MARISHVLGALGISVVLIAGIAAFLQWRSPAPEEALLPHAQQLSGPFSPEELAITQPDTTTMTNPTAILKTNHGDITLELYANLMPITTQNFIALARDGFYDGTKFHRVIPGFMIQGGDPHSRGTDTASYGTGGPGFTIVDEFVENDRLSNTRGTIAMANTGQPNSGGSQFFINVADNTGLDFDKAPLTSKHPVFGRVIGGMEVVDAITRLSTDERDVPTEPVTVAEVVIEDSL